MKSKNKKNIIILILILLFAIIGAICFIIIENQINSKMKEKAFENIQVNIEQKMKDGYGLLNEGSLIYVSPQMTYNGINITKEEINQLLLKTEGLSYIKDKWVEVDKKKLQCLLDEYEELKLDGSTLSEVLKKYSTIEESDINIKFSNPNWFTDIVQKNLER